MGNNSPFSYIRAGEGPEKLKGGMIISAGRIFLRVEVTQILLSAVNFNNGAPLTPALVPTNAFQSAFVMRGGSHICAFWLQVAKRRLERRLSKPSQFA